MIPVVISPYGLGIPVKQVESGAPVMKVSEHGLGIPIVLAEWGAPFIVMGIEPPENLPGPIIDLTVLSTTTSTAALAFTDAQYATSHEYSLDEGDWEELALDKIITGLDPDTTYDVQVRGVNEFGVGPASNTVQAVTQEVPEDVQYGRDPDFNAGTTFDYIVADDDSGDFSTVQEALDQLAADGTGGTIGIKKETVEPYAPVSLSDYSGPLITISSYGADDPVIGPKRLPALTPCDSGDADLLGAAWSNCHKVTIPVADISHDSYQALIPTENGELLTLATRRANESDLFAQDDTNAFFTGVSPDLIFTVDGSGYLTSIQHTSVLSAYTDTQLEQCVVGVHASSNLYAPAPVTSVSSGVLSISPDLELTPQATANKYSLMNIAAAIEEGGWAYALNGDGTITIYAWLTNPANADKVDIAANTHAITLTNCSNIDIQGITVAQVSGGSATSPTGGFNEGTAIFLTNCTDINVRQWRGMNYSFARRGYGSVYAAGGSDIRISNFDLLNGQNSFGLFGSGVSQFTAERCDAVRISQTVPRIFGCTDFVVADIRTERCCFAAHANLFNAYLYCNRGVFLNFNPLTDEEGRNLAGYSTISSSSNIVILNSIIPAGPDGRAFVDQFAETQEPPEETSTIIIANCLLPGIPGWSDMEQNAIVYGNEWWPTDYRVFNSVYHGIEKRHPSETISTLTVEGNVKTLGAPTEDEVSARPIDIYMDDAAGDFRTIPGSVLTAPGSLPTDLTAIVEMIEGWRPDYDFRRDALGNTWDPADPGVGPYGKTWPVATDTTAPVLSDLGYQVAGTSVTITVTTDKFGGVIDWSLDNGVDEPTTGSHEVLEAGEQNILASVPGDGTYELSVQQTDRFGNVSNELTDTVEVSGYTPNWVSFDGSTRLRRAAALTGAADTKAMLIAYTFRMTEDELAFGQMNSGIMTTLPSTAGGGNVDIGPTPGFRLRDPSSSSNFINMLARTSGDAALQPDTDYLLLFRYTSNDEDGRIGETVLIDIAAETVLVKATTPAADESLSFEPVTQTDLFRADQNAGTDGGFSIERFMLWDNASPDITDEAVQEVFVMGGELQDPLAAHLAFGQPLIDPVLTSGSNRGTGGNFNIV